MAETAAGSVYVRLSLMRPRHGEDGRVGELLNELVKFYAAQPGYLGGYTLAATDAGNEVGRLTLWRSEHDADHVASQQHVLSLRSELLRLVETGSHVERSFQGEAQPAPEAAH